jgi:hypothetical protein
MRDRLHIFEGDPHITAFDLQPGSRLVGIGDDAALVLVDNRVSSKSCHLGVSRDGQVVLLALPNAELRAPNAERASNVLPADSQCVETAGLTFALLRKRESIDGQIDPPRAVLVTTKSNLIHAPPAETRAVLPTLTRGTIGRELLGHV